MSNISEMPCASYWAELLLMVAHASTQGCYTYMTLKLPDGTR